MAEFHPTDGMDSGVVDTDRISSFTSPSYWGGVALVGVDAEAMSPFMRNPNATAFVQSKTVPSIVGRNSLFALETYPEGQEFFASEQPQGTVVVYRQERLATGEVFNLRVNHDTDNDFMGPTQPNIREPSESRYGLRSRAAGTTYEDLWQIGTVFDGLLYTFPISSIMQTPTGGYHRMDVASPPWNWQIGVVHHFRRVNPRGEPVGYELNRITTLQVVRRPTTTGRFHRVWDRILGVIDNSPEPVSDAPA
ncbi:hypothetical protein KDA14_01550 [Candidatus Saccharibacteria bacterium]|nr:hypothetical protein [Candidatus Saccharibacteria bacterium]